MLNESQKLDSEETRNDTDLKRFFKKETLLVFYEMYWMLSKEIWRKWWNR